MQSRRFFAVQIGRFLPLLWMAACLPDPEISVPDLRSLGAVDLGPSPNDLSQPPDGKLTRWVAEQNVPAAPTLRAVCAGEGGQLHVAGHNGTILLFDGKTWTRETAENAGTAIVANFYALLAHGKDIYAAGESGVIVKRDGNRWLQEAAAPAGKTSLYALAVSQEGDVFAVGDAGLVMRKTAGVWGKDSVAGTLGLADFRGVAAGSSSALYAVGLGGVVARRTATAWELDPVPMDPTDRTNFYSVVATGQATFAVGDYGRVMRRDADKWHREQLPVGVPQTGHLFSVAPDGPGLLAVGASGVIVRRDAQSQTWTADDSGTSLSLSAVSAVSPSRAVGAQGLILVQK